MSDTNQDKAGLVEEDKNSFGEKLKKIRENKGLSVQDVAVRLRLSPRFINMLENENLLQVSLPRIYLRGYLRSYAQLLNVSEVDLAQVLQKLDPKPVIIEPIAAASAVEAPSFSFSFPFEMNAYYTRLATFLVSLLLLTSIMAWWYLHSSADSATMIAVNQSTHSEQTVVPLASENTALTGNNTASATVMVPAAAQAPVPAAPVNLATKKPVALVSTVAASTARKSVVPSAKGQEESDDDNNIDEQE